MKYEMRFIPTDNPIPKIDEFSRGLQNRIGKGAMRAGLVPVKAATKVEARKHKRSGALAVSIATKVYVGKQTKEVIGLVGSKKGYFKTGPTRTRGKFKGEVAKYIPAKYLPILQKGAVRKNRGTMRPIDILGTGARVAGRTMAHIYANKIKEGMDREFAKRGQ